MPLPPEQARALYDRFGARQDRQAWYQDPAVDILVGRGAFDKARAVVEFGCGTGRLAERLLRENLPDHARYLASDLSGTMCVLSRERLARWKDRVEVRLTDGAPRIRTPDGTFDRFVSTYVLDLLPDEFLEPALEEAHRLLAPDGSLCLAGLTCGVSLRARAVGAVWRAVHAVRPRWVGGCRPMNAAARLDPARWELLHREVVEVRGLASEALVARRR